MIGAAAIGALTPFLVAVAPSRVVEGFLFLLAAQSLDLIHPLIDVNTLTLRQVSTPEELQGRVNATLHVIARGVIPLGAIAGGLLGDAIGFRQTLLIGAGGIVFATLWLARSLRGASVRPSVHENAAVHIEGLASNVVRHLRR